MDQIQQTKKRPFESIPCSETPTKSSSIKDSTLTMVSPSPNTKTNKRHSKSKKDESLGGLFANFPLPYSSSEEGEWDNETEVESGEDKPKKEKKSNKVAEKVKEENESPFDDYKPTKKAKRLTKKTKKEEEEPQDNLRNAPATYESLNKLKLLQIDEKLGELGLSKAGSKGAKIERLLEGEL